MERMTVCKGDMAVLPQRGAFAAEPFAFLAFAQGIFARAQSQLGHYRPLSLIYRQEPEEQPPVRGLSGESGADAGEDAEEEKQ